MKKCQFIQSIQIIEAYKILELLNSIQSQNVNYFSKQSRKYDLTIISLFSIVFTMFPIISSFQILINLMIINTIDKEKQVETISYIRKLTNLTNNSHPSLAQQSDSLNLSHSDSDSLSVRVIIPQPPKKKQSHSSTKYVSPYKQNGISMKKIMKNNPKLETHLARFPNITLQDFPKRDISPKKPKLTNIANRYLKVPSLIQKLQKNEVDIMKTEAKMMYNFQQLKQKQHERENQQLSENERKAKWADFLLRERRWEQKKQVGLMKIKQKIISQQKQYETNRTANDYPKMNVQEHIKKIKREKIKLEHQLRQLQPNYYTWQNHHSPLSKKTDQAHLAKSQKSSNRKMISLSSQKEIRFLIDKRNF